ncbi:uncharacterized protein LOC109706988 [Ananas comosus]|uniref:Uncharacterized protein LOC109706988 n=1 Tax=Ananas comosus TaxID=4615 RepID=A0A6P5EQY0_ANACO|nr:uncharacterized protein LOC109706988 [Ananas comosus]
MLPWGCQEFGQTLGRGTKTGTVESITWHGNLAGHAYALTCMPQVYARNNWLRRFRWAPAVESTTDQQMLRTYPPTQFVEYVTAWQKQQQHGLRGGFPHLAFGRGLSSWPENDSSSSFFSTVVLSM